LLAIRQSLVKRYFSAEILQEYAEVLAEIWVSARRNRSTDRAAHARGEEVQVPITPTAILPDAGDESS
jgi:hypothetical protein